MSKITCDHLKNVLTEKVGASLVVCEKRKREKELKKRKEKKKKRKPGERRQKEKEKRRKKKEKEQTSEKRGRKRREQRKNGLIDFPFSWPLMNLMDVEPSFRLLLFPTILREFLCSKDTEW